MTCHIDNQIADHANADNQACAEMEYNETAMADLFIHGEAEFSNGEVELWSAVDKACDDEQELIRALVHRIAMDDLTAITELRMLLTGIAVQQNEAMAKRH